MTRWKLFEVVAVAMFAGGTVAMIDTLLTAMMVPLMLHVIVIGLTGAAFAVGAMAGHDRPVPRMKPKWIECDLDYRDRLLDVASPDIIPAIQVATGYDLDSWGVRYELHRRISE